VPNQVNELVEIDADTVAAASRMAVIEVLGPAPVESCDVIWTFPVVGLVKALHVGVSETVKVNGVVLVTVPVAGLAVMVQPPTVLKLIAVTLTDGGRFVPLNEQFDVPVPVAATVTVVGEHTRLNVGGGADCSVAVNVYVRESSSFFASVSFSEPVVPGVTEIVGRRKR
jgi:hypothetical protein